VKILFIIELQIRKTGFVAICATSHVGHNTKNKEGRGGGKDGTQHTKARLEESLN
jgi:hypothetical protein